MDISADRFKDCTYGQFVCDVRPTKAEPNRTRLVVGGDRINYPGDVGTPTADMLLVKSLFNSVISIDGARFMTGDINCFTTISHSNGMSMCGSSWKIFQKK